jgi:hypothetical protein
MTDLLRHFENEEPENLSAHGRHSNSALQQFVNISSIILICISCLNILFKSHTLPAQYVFWSRASASLGPNTWIPWCYAMLGAMVLFILNGLYQRSSWWNKGGKETLYEDVDPLERIPSRQERQISRLGGSFQVGGATCRDTSCKLCCHSCRSTRSGVVSRS